MASLSGDFHDVTLSTHPGLYRARRDGYFQKEPREIGHFSFDGEREFHDDKSELRVFYPPDNYRNCRFDLNAGYKSMIWRDDSGDGAFTYCPTNLLTWAMHHPEKLKPPSGAEGSERATSHLKRLNTDFVCKRGLLTKILCLPYERNEDFRLAVTRMRGTYYLCQIQTADDKMAEAAKMMEPQRRRVAGGWKFEQYVTADNIGETPNTERPVNNNMEYGVVVRSQVGSHSLVYGGEVDCFDPNDETSYIELKTSKIITNDKMLNNFCRYKLIKFWAQSYLLGINKVVCGFKDESDIVRELKDYEVEGIPTYANSQIGSAYMKWDPAVCFNFLDSFLTFIKDTIPNDDEKCGHVFYFEPKRSLIYEGADAKSKFLPDWFLNWEQWEK